MENGQPRPGVTVRLSKPPSLVAWDGMVVEESTLASAIFLHLRSMGEITGWVAVTECCQFNEERQCLAKDD